MRLEQSKTKQVVRRSVIVSLTLALIGAGQAQILDQGLDIGPTPNYKVSGPIDYITIGASFRTDTGGNSTNSEIRDSGQTYNGYKVSTYRECTVKTTTGTSPGGGTYAGGYTLPNIETTASGATSTVAERSENQTVPRQATIRAAYLYWTATQDGSAASEADTTVELVAGSKRQVVAADRYWTAVNSGSGSGNTAGDMGAVADVTAFFTDPSIVNQDITLNGLDVANYGTSCRNRNVYANWGLYIVYEQEGLSNRVFNLYDGLEYVYGQGTQAQVRATGFELPAAPSGDKVAKLTFYGSDGDTNGIGDTVLVSSDADEAGQGDRVLSNSFNGVNNAFNSTVSYADVDGTVEGRQPVPGLDLDTYDVTNTIPTGASAITATANSDTGELVILYNMAVMASYNISDVKVRKSIDKNLETITVGTPFTYRIKVDNHNSPAPDYAEALAVTTTDNLPVGFTYKKAEVSYDNGETWENITSETVPSANTAGPTTITFPTVRRLDQNGAVWGGDGEVAALLTPEDAIKRNANGQIIEGADILYRITVVPNGDAAGQLINKVKVTTGSLEADTTNNDSQAPITVINSATITVTKKPTLGFETVTYNEGDEVVQPKVSYDIVVSNTSNVTAENVEIRDKLASDLNVNTFRLYQVTPEGRRQIGTRDIQTNSIIANIGNVAPGETLRFQISGKAPTLYQIEKPLKDGDPDTVFDGLLNTVYLTANNADNSQDDAIIKASYAVLSKRVRNITAETDFGTSVDGRPGDVLEYCLDFVNYGNTDLTNYRVEDSIPAQVKYVGQSLTTTGVEATDTFQPGQAGKFGRGLVSASVNPLEAGAQGTTCFRVTVD